MRFEVTYSSGTKHEVDVAGTVVVLGRDPGCDVVLNDVKCSRRHAVVEVSASGSTIRDSASANGVLVNGRRVDAAPLRAGDLIRLGDVQLLVLPEIGETVVVATDDAELQPPPSFAADVERPRRDRLPAAPRANRPRPPPGPRRARPLTVSVLSILWAIAGPAAAVAAALLTWRLGGGLAAEATVSVLAIVLCAAGLAMSLGLWALAPWALHLQVASALLALLACPFTPAAATTLLYLNRSDVRCAFRGGASREGAGGAETTFALSLVAMVCFGVVASVVVGLLAWPRR